MSWMLIQYENFYNIMHFRTFCNFNVCVSKLCVFLLAPYLLNCNKTSPEPGDKLQMEYKGIMRTDNCKLPFHLKLKKKQ